jgi:hypothetical protein
MNGIGPDRPSYARQYYPGEIAFDRSSAIDVQPGVEVSELNFSLARQSLHRIRGKIVDLATGRPPSDADIALKALGVADPGGVTPATEVADVKYNGETGAFELRGLMAGAYTLIATPGVRAGLSDNPVAMDTAAYTKVQITDNDVDDITLTLAPGATITGRVTVEGSKEPIIEVLPSWAYILLRPTLDDGSVIIRNLPDVPIHDPSKHANQYEACMWPCTKASSVVQPDGSFRVDNARPGQYRLSVDRLPAGYYVKEARFGGAEGFQDRIVVAGPTAGPLNIVIGFSTAIVSGRVADTPKSETLVVLVPDRLRNQPERIRTVQVDADGRFTMRGVPPGAYKAYVWTGLPSAAYYNMEFMQQIEGYGAPVQVRDGETTSLTLRPFRPQ